MTDKPTPEQIQRACDLINTEARAGGDGSTWNPLDFDVFPSLKVLADTIAKLDAKDAMVDGQAELIATLTAERDKAVADLREIAAITGSQAKGDPVNGAVYAIAAPYRVETDPLVEAFRAIHSKDIEEGVEWSVDITRRLSAELAKRGLEIGRAA